MPEDYRPNVETFDEEEITVTKRVDTCPTVEETALAVAKSARRDPVIGLTMQEARAVGLLNCPFVSRKERCQRWTASKLMAVIGIIRRLRGSPVKLSAEERARASSILPRTPVVPIGESIAKGDSDPVFDAYRDWMK